MTTKLIDHLKSGRPISARLVKEIVAELEWLQGCWDAVSANGKNNPDGHKALRKTFAAGVAIKEALDKEMANGLLETDSEVTVAMCIVAEDTLDSMPAKHPGRRAWTYLLKVLYDLWKLTDDDESDWRGYERGKRIAARVLDAAQ